MIVSRDKSLLCPTFAARLAEFERILSIDHLPFYLFEGFRTIEASNEYYAKGRTTHGNLCIHDGVARPIGTCQIHPLGLTITNAKGGDSMHNYGIGADYVLDGMLDRPGVQWSWDLKMDANRDGRNDWHQMGELAERCGLVWGGRWKKFTDFPHLEMPGLTLNEIKEFYRQGGIKRVWEEYKS
jgi:peptidoglycan LD-endopeptidase CwlK